MSVPCQCRGCSVGFLFPFVVAFTGSDRASLPFLETQDCIRHFYHSSNHFSCVQDASPALRVTAVTGVTVTLGYPLPLSPCGRTPHKRKVQAWDFLALLRLVNPPLRSEKSPIFPTAFTGCNTLHLAGKERVPDFPSGLPFGKAHALLYPPLSASDKRTVSLSAVSVRESIPISLSHLSRLSTPFLVRTICLPLLLRE